MRLNILLLMWSSLAIAYPQHITQDMKNLHHQIEQSFGYIPQLFVLHRGHHFDDIEWYHDVSTQVLHEISYENEYIDQWLKLFSLKWKCNKPGKSYVVDGVAFEENLQTL